MFEQILADLLVQEENRQIIELPLEFFMGTWDKSGKHVIVNNEMRMSQVGFNHLTQFVNRGISDTIATTYLWNFPDGLNYMMPQHVDEYLEHPSARQEPIRVLVHGDIITAMLSDRYVDFSNYELVKRFAEYCEAVGLEPKNVSFKSFDDYMDAIRLVSIFEQYDLDYSIYGAGVLLANSQNKTRGLLFSPIVKSTACDNSITSFGDHRWRHIQGADEFVDRTLNLTSELIDLAITTYDNYLKATSTKVQNFDRVIDAMVRKFKLSKKLREKLIEGLTSERKDLNDTLFNLVSGLTYVAQFIEKSNPDESMRMLFYAGELLKFAEKESVTYGEIVWA